jgi:hypothetical protein
MSAEAYRKQQLEAEEQRVLADLRAHGELVLVHRPEWGSLVWVLPEAGKHRPPKLPHSTSVVKRLAKRGKVVIVRETRAVLAP